MRAKVASFLNGHLGSWVDDVHEDDVQISLWNASAQIQQINLKKSVHQISPGVDLAVEEGSIGRLCLCIPWLLYGFGKLEAIVEDVDVFLKLDFSEPAEHVPPASDNTDLKSIIHEELLMLGCKEKLGWGQKITDVFVGRIAASLIPRISLLVKRINIHVLLPTSENVCNIIKIVVDSVAIDNPLNFIVAHPEKDVESSHFLAKSLSIRGLKVYFRKAEAAVKSPKEPFNDNFRNDLSGLVLSPLNLSLSIKTGLESLRLANVAHILTVISELSVSCIDMNMSLDEVSALVDLLDFIHFNIIRIKLAPLRRTIFVAEESKVMESDRGLRSLPRSRPKFCARKTWRFAIKAIIETLKLDQKRLSMERLVSALKAFRPKLRYAQLWSHRLRQSYAPAASELSVDENAELDNLEQSLSKDDLVFVRTLVLGKLLVENQYATALCSALVNSTRELSDSLLATYEFPSFQHGDHEASEIIDTNDVFKKTLAFKAFLAVEDICLTFLSVSPQDPSPEESRQKSTLKDRDRLVRKQPRIAFSNEERWRQRFGLSPSPPPSPVRYGSFCSLNVHCAKFVVENGSGGDYTFEFMLGSLNVFGIGNFSLLQLGDGHSFEDPKSHRYNYDSSDRNYCTSVVIRVLNHSPPETLRSISWKKVGKTFVSDVSGRVASAFFKPSPRRVFAEIRLQEVRFLWHGESIRSIMTLVKHLTPQTKLSVRKADLNTSAKLSELKCEFSDSKCSVEEKFRLSADISVSSVRFMFAITKSPPRPFLVALHEKTKFMELAIQNIYFCSGDFLESILPREDSHTENNPTAGSAMLEQNSLNDHFDPSLEAKHIARDERNALVRPRLVQFEGFCIHYCDLENKEFIGALNLPKVPVSNERHAVLRPWNVCCVWIPSFAKAHEDFTDDRVEIFCADLNVLLDTQDIVNVLKIMDVSEIDFEKETTIPTPQMLSPRFEKLSMLSVLYLRVNLYRVSFSVVDDKAKQASLSSKSILTNTLQRYAAAVLGDLNDPVLNVVQRDLALQRFVNVGVDKKLAMNLLTQFYRELWGCRFYSSDQLSNLAERILQDIPTFTHSQVLLKMDLNRVAFELHQLTYDYRVSVVIDSLAVVNNARSSLVFIRDRKPASELSRMYSYDDAMFVDSPDLPEQCLQKSGISVQIIKKDDRFPFGNGGVPLSTILSQNDSSMEKQYSFSLTVNIHEIGFDIDPSVMSQILADVENIRRNITDRIKPTVAKHVPVRSLEPETLTAECGLPQKPHLFFSLSVDELNCFVAHKDRSFAQLILDDIVLHFERDKEDCSAVDAAVDYLELLDLTPLGKLHRHVVWKCTDLNKAAKVPMFVCTVFFSDEQNVILFSLNMMRANVVCRFLVEEMIEFAQHCVLKCFSTDCQEAIDRYSESNDSFDQHPTAQPYQTASQTKESIFRIFISDAQLHVPRNSLSNDSMCVVASSIEVAIGDTRKLFDTPSPDIVASCESGHLYYDVDYNTWRRTAPQQPEGNDHEIFMDEFLPSIQEEPSPTESAMRINIVAKGLDVFTSVEPLLRGKSVFPKFHVDHGADLFGDADEVNLLDIGRPSPLNCEVVTEGFVRNMSEEWRFLDNKQVWFKNTRESFNLHVIVDIGQDSVKLLFADTKEYSRLNVVMTHCEYHVFLALWFDNVSEKAQFLQGEYVPPERKMYFTENDLGIAETHLSKYGSKSSIEYLLGRPVSFELMLVRAEVIACCALEVNQYKRDIPLSSHLSNMAQYDRETAFDAQFAKRSDVTDQRKPNSSGSLRKVVPFVDLRVASFVLCVQNFYDVIRLFISGEMIEAYDVSTSKQTGLKAAIPLILRVCRRGTDERELMYDPNWPHLHNFTYGLPDMYFGFKQNAPTESSLSDVPFKMSLLNSDATNWMTINIGVDLADVNVHNLDVILVSSDFFSVYFRFEEFNHPALPAFNKSPLSRFLGGGLDLRVFVTRPHVSLLYSCAHLSTPALFLEMIRGASFRFIFDTFGSSRYELFVGDLAAVLVKRFRAPAVLRGARGSSGSGRGVRTTVEHLNIEFVHHFDVASEEVDVKIDLYGVKKAITALLPVDYQLHNNVVDIYSQWNGSHVALLPEPTCLRPIRRSEHTFKPPATIDVVTCFEDVLFCVNVICNLFSIDIQELFRQKPDNGGDINEMIAQRKSPIVFVCGLFDLRFMLVDNVLGMHLPFFQVMVEEVIFCFDRIDRANEVKEEAQELKNNSNISPFFRHLATEVSSNKLDEKVFIQGSLWGEYFNSLRKCWEPLCEKIRAHALYEQSALRGKGFSVHSETAIHFNFTGALVKALFDTMRTWEGKDSDVSTEHVSVIHKKLLEQNNNLEWIDDFEGRGKNAVSSDAERYGEKMHSREKIIHLPAPIDPKLRVGFSILNLTGQPVRYLQHYADGRRVVQYLNDGERGLLNFVATQSLLRNKATVEEPFDVQQPLGRDTDGRKTRIGGNNVTLQVSGYRWLVRVQVDELGTRFEELCPILGRTQRKTDHQSKGFLKLMVEVTPYCGGRMLTLRSVFLLRNNTNHTMLIKSRRHGDDTRSTGDHDSFNLSAGADLHIPLAMLHTNFLRSDGRSLGALYIKPLESKPINDDLGRSDAVESEYSTDPINLMSITTNASAPLRSTESTENLVGFAADESLNDAMSQHGLITQLYCPVRSKSNSKDNKSVSDRTSFKFEHSLVKYPPFCYCVEVVPSNEPSHDTSYPAHYNIAIHPPITIENLLSMGAFFEIVRHEDKEQILWSSFIEPGRVVPIHTVSLDDSLDLMITLRYCRSSEGVCIHQPMNFANRAKGFAKTLKRTLEGFLDEGEKEEISTIVLTDSVGQKLRLHVENNEGGGGQKNIVVYCPYWIVNTTQCVYRVREEGELDLPAGTRVSEQKDGTRNIPHIYFSNYLDKIRPSLQTPSSRRNLVTPSRSAARSPDRKSTISFPGLPGPFHNLDVPVNAAEWELLNEMSFDKIVDYAYMFNFKEEATFLSINKKVKIQLEDSDWSRSISFDSVGVNQALSIEHAELGILEVGFKVNLAPGRLSKYTKIIRFLPRFTFVNRLDVGVKVVQADGFGEEGSDDNKQHEKYVAANHAKTYHLPVVFGERKVFLKIDGPWEKTVPINIDQIGAFSLELKRHFDLASVPHVNTRGAAEYSVTLPPNQPIGLAFETDWGEENVVVKSLQIGSFAARETDIKVGDVLIAIDNIPVVGKPFENVMELLKSTLSKGSVLIKFRTVEEKLRLIREDAIEKRKSERRRSMSIFSPQRMLSPLASTIDIAALEASRAEVLPVRVEFRPIDSSVMIVVSPLSAQDNVEYRIENRSVCFHLYFKQKGIVGNAWSSIPPGETAPLVWEDPFKPHKLLIHVGDNVLSPSDFRNGKALREGVEFGGKGKGDHDIGMYLTYLSGVVSESAMTMNMDEIGSVEMLPVRKDSSLIASIKSEGPTKILHVAPSLDDKQIFAEMEFCHKLFLKQTASLEQLQRNIRISPDSSLENFSFPKLINEAQSCLQEIQVHQKTLITSPLPNESNIQPNFVSYEPIERIFEGGIDSLHQVKVEVFEAKELPMLVAGKLEDTYCKISVFSKEKMNFVERGLAQSYCTYVFDQSMDPSWVKQKFIFDVPPDAADYYRGYNVRILVKAKSLIGMDTVLAKLDIPFSSLKEEKWIEGWFPLRPSRATLLSGNVSGSIRLRLRWIHSKSKFWEYFEENIDRRIKELKDCFDNERFKLIRRLSNARLDLLGDGSSLAISEREMSSLRLSSEDETDDDVSTLFDGPSPIRPVRRELISSLLSPSIDLNDKRSFVSADTPLLGAHKVQHIFRDKYDFYYRVCEKFQSVHDRLKDTMKRSDSFQQSNQMFAQTFTRECLRNYVHVSTQKGRLRIIPAQITNLPELGKNLHIKVSYGKETFKTGSKPYGPSVTWFNDDSESEFDYLFNASEMTESSSALLVTDHQSMAAKEIVFDVDMLNVRGTLKVRVMSETFPKYQEVARVEIPMSSILDCCCLLPGDSWYEAWFPLVLSRDRSSVISDVAVQRMESKTEQFHFGDYQCNIRLRLQWQSDRVEESIFAVSEDQASDAPVFYGRCQIPSFSVSMIDSEHARAVMLATVIGIELRHAVTKEHTDVGLNVTNLQVDNELPDSYSPVIVAPTRVKSPQPVVRVHVRKNNLISRDRLACFKTIQMVVQELDVKLEQQTVLASWEFVKNLFHQKRYSDSYVEAEARIFGLDASVLIQEELLQSRPSGSPFFVSPSPDTPKRSGGRLLKSFQTPQPSDATQRVKGLLEDADELKLYIENFSISSIKINVSFITTPQHIVQHYRVGTKTDLRNERSLGIFSAISFFLWQVGEVVLDLTSSISDAPIYFNGFQAAYLFKTAVDIQETLLEHYLHNALGQLYKIVGSMDLVGNPIGLLSSLGVGVHDFFYEPAHALINNPTEIGKIGKGVVKGTVSLVSNTTDGFLSTGTTITRSVGRGFAKLSMDSSFLKAREKLQKPPATLRDTMSRPLKDIGNGVYFGVTGLVKVPFSSVRKQGPSGLLPGVVKGVAGLAADPIVGILDAVTHSGDAFRGLLKSSKTEHDTHITRIRFSDLFGLDGRLLPYDHGVAYGAQVIQSLSKLPSSASHKTSDHEHRHRSDSAPLAPSTPATPATPIIITNNRASYRLPPDHLQQSSALAHSSLSSHTVHSMQRKNSVAAGQGGENNNGSKTAECVIYTAVLHKSDLLAVLTTERIAVVELAKRHAKTVPKVKWEVPLLSVHSCELEEDRGRSNYILYIRESRDPIVRSPSSPHDFVGRAKNRRKSIVQVPLSFLADADAEVEHKIVVSQLSEESRDLLNFVDCVHTMLAAQQHKSSWEQLFVHTDSGDVEAAVRGDEYNVRHIGPWQFVLSAETHSWPRSKIEGELSATELEREEWKCTSSVDMSTKPRPTWLLAEEKEALAAHSHVAELEDLCNKLTLFSFRRKTQENEHVKDALTKLYAGEISGEEFKRKINSHRLQTSDESSVTCDSSTENNSVNTNSKKMPHFFASTVSTVAKLFGKAKSSEISSRSKVTGGGDETSIDGKEQKNYSETPTSLLEANEHPLSQNIPFSESASHHSHQSRQSHQPQESSHSRKVSFTPVSDEWNNETRDPEDSLLLGTVALDSSEIAEQEPKLDQRSLQDYSHLSAYYLPPTKRNIRRSTMVDFENRREGEELHSDVVQEATLFEQTYSSPDDVKEEENPLLHSTSVSKSAPLQLSDLLEKSSTTKAPSKQKRKNLF